MPRALLVTLCALAAASCGGNDGHAQPPPSAGAIAGELDGVLDERPVVLVGASFGGYVVQLFASGHPADVAGVVPVDSLHPEIDTTFRRLFGKQAAAARARQLEDNSERITFADLRRSAAGGRGGRGVPRGATRRPQARHLLRPWRRARAGAGARVGRMQAQLAALSAQGRVVVAERSHHRIAEDQPEVVAAAIRRVAGTP
jgi:pimeloyl-ACP methyl ester carboxylesterase